MGLFVRKSVIDMKDNYVLRKIVDGKTCEHQGKMFKVVGKVIKKETNKVVLEIWSSNNCTRACELYYLEASRGERYGKFGIVIISNDFYNIVFLKKIKIAKACIFHELGHYLNGDLNLDMVNMNNERIKLLKDFKLLLSEEKADYFAASELGVQNVIDALIYMKKNRNACIGDKNYELAIREYDLRIQTLKKTFNI